MVVRYLSDAELYHHGVKGQKWGVRRYQNPDGSLTAAGKKRYLKDWQRSYDKHADIRKYGSEFEGIKNRQEYKDTIKSLENKSDFVKVTKEKKEIIKQIEQYEKEYAEDSIKWTQEAVKNYYGHDDKWVNDTTDGRNSVWFWHEEDGDSGGEGGSFDMYLKSKGTSYDKIDEKLNNVHERQQAIVKKTVSDILKDNADIQIKNKYGNKETIGRVVEDAISELKETDYGYYPFYGIAPTGGTYYSETNSFRRPSQYEKDRYDYILRNEGNSSTPSISKMEKEYDEMHKTIFVPNMIKK